jgi:transcriptional regulator GlxA family with amidase domain
MADMKPIEPRAADEPGRRPVHVSLVVFPECDPSIIYGVFDTLWAAGRLWQAAKGVKEELLFEPRLVAAEKGPLPLMTGVTIVPQDSIAEVAETDVVFVPNVMIENAAALRGLDRRLLDWIRRMYAAGAQIYSACGGSLVLAEAGLLDGRETTTHWVYVPLFREEFPDVVLHQDRILVQTGPGHSIVCAGGASSWQDLSLLLIAKHGGNEEAIRISKFFLYQWHREGQLPFASMAANVDHGDAAILKCQTWLADNYERPEIVSELAKRSGLPKRTFDRRFKAATGYAPLAYVQALRIEEAKQLLETTATRVDAIAREVGYEDLASFRRLFRRLSGMTPGDYRRKFRMPGFIKQAVGKEDQKPMQRAGGPPGRNSARPRRGRLPVSGTEAADGRKALRAESGRARRR